MTDTCDACRATVDTKLSSIGCTKCSRNYHLLCVNLSAVGLSAEFRADWICPTCRSKEPKGDNSDTPVRSSTAKTPAREYVTQRSKKESTFSPLDASANDSMNSMILAEVRLLRQDMNEFKNHFKEATDRTNNRMDDFDCALNEFKRQITETAEQNRNKLEEYDLSLYASMHRITGLEEAQPIVASLEERIIKLEEVTQHQLQATLRNELEIVGIPENPNENLSHIVFVAARKIGQELQENDLDWVERVGPKSTKGQDGQRSRSRLIVVRFARRDKRDAFLSAAKVRRNLSSSDLETNGPTTEKVYINERLTKTGRQLFQEARRRSKQNGFRHCWTRNGMVFIRKEEGRPAISIRSQADLDRHLKPNDAPVAPRPAVAATS